MAVRRYLLTDGAQGAMLDWYTTIRAARYLGVPPWELLQQPVFWQYKALESEGIDAEVQEARQQQDMPPTPS